MSKGTGTFAKRGNSWRGQFVINGKRISITKRTKKEVIDEANLMRAAALQGNYVERSDTTVREYFELWFNKYIKSIVSEQTVIHYKAMFENHILPALGDIKLQELSKSDIEINYANTFHKKRNGNSYSHSTVNSLSVQFKKMLQSAVDNGYLNKNPHNGIELHKLRPPKKVSAYNQEEQKIIIEFCKRKQLDWVFYFLITTGVRYGEATALTWSDVNFEDKTIDINKTVVEYHGSATIQNKPKTDAGFRTIVISDKVAEFLKMVKASQEEELNFRNLVFPNSMYNIMGSANSTRRWKDDCEKMGIPYKGKHALRHTWATRALEAGTNVKVVSHMLGHKNVITTMNIYQDVLQPEQESVAEVMNKFC